MTNIHLTETPIDRDKLFERVLETLNTALKETVHTVEGAPQASVLMKNDQYRTKPVFGDQELFFKDVRIGKSGKIIFSFTAVDDVEWKQCEWDSAQLDKAVPLFGVTMAEKLRYAGEHLPTLVDLLIKDTENQMLAEIEQEKVAAAEVHANNPKFGRF
ncbi:hypothetical protein [Shinella zoogloeoides]|uniref:hypothetical protein n=1 Tax=Shinella zoogloeoides TaxID=352475 RepID=UPI00273F4ADF|nr:hypothetical protein [Shinella zoogloeoides]WLR90888.1 hypothetical protein Q9316_00495 [Shinella zoogloeoides]